MRRHDAVARSLVNPRLAIGDAEQPALMRNVDVEARDVARSFPHARRNANESRVAPVAGRMGREAVSAARCAAGDCDRDAARGGLCWAHLKRRQRLKDLSAPLREWGMTALERMAKAALRYSNADDTDEDEYRRATRRLYEAKKK
ncbi:MAG: hypothetical protein ACREXY_13280 [Gammaproteobacteria bacterium]